MALLVLEFVILGFKIGELENNNNNATLTTLKISLGHSFIFHNHLLLFKLSFILPGINIIFYKSSHKLSQLMETF